MIQWKLNGKPCDDIPLGCIGFVYIIYYTDGTYYVGKKLAKSLRKKKPLVGMRKNARRMVMTEHKWREYEGSTEFSKGRVIKEKEILAWCATKQGMTYIETALQFNMNVLFDKMALNKNILGKFFPNVLEAEEDIYAEHQLYKIDKEG